MCIFSAQYVDKVSATNIFARFENGRQVLVYGMDIQTRTDVAMILPLPVHRESGEEAVRFISLQGYPYFFRDMKTGFPLPIAWKSSSPAPATATRTMPKLIVHEVGDFEASYVPTANDWDRLDKRFRIPPVVFDAVPGYRAFGFAVFKLKSTTRKTWFRFLGSKVHTRRIHPMAFEFPRADSDRLFFPTVHVHDGQFHPLADFDHTLFCQYPFPLNENLARWTQSTDVASTFLKIEKGNGTVKPDLFCYKRDIRGQQKNEDVWV